MTEQELNSIIRVFDFLGEESLNDDPLSFAGKIVFPCEDKIGKIMTTYDAVSDMEIFEEAEKLGITFYQKPEIIKTKIISVLLQDKLELKKFSTSFQKMKKRETLNSWMGGFGEEEVISQIVYEHYGEKEWYKIKEFNEKWKIGNIYWRNIGFNSKGRIQCFDFQCGLARDERGKHIV